MSLQAKILRFLEAQPRVWVVKVEIPNFRGCPDILCCIKGKFVAIEVKDKSDTIKVHQYEELCKIVESGHYSFIVALSENFKTLQRDLNKFEIDRKAQSFNTCTMITIIDLEEFKKWFTKFTGDG